MADLTKAFQPSRRGFLLGAAATLGMRGSIPQMIAAIAPTELEVASAYGWLADHMSEGVWDGKSYMPSHILKTMQTISHHLNASGLPNPVEGKLEAVRQLSEIHLDFWKPGMPEAPRYEPGSPERILMNEIHDMLNPVSAMLKQPTPLDKIFLDRQAAYTRSRALVQTAENTIVREEVASVEPELIAETESPSLLRTNFVSYVQDLVTKDEEPETEALPAPLPKPEELSPPAP